MKSEQRADAWLCSRGRGGVVYSGHVQFRDSVLFIKRVALQISRIYFVSFLFFFFLSDLDRRLLSVRVRREGARSRAKGAKFFDTCSRASRAPASLAAVFVVHFPRLSFTQLETVALVAPGGPPRRTLLLPARVTHIRLDAYRKFSRLIPLSKPRGVYLVSRRARSSVSFAETE